MRFPKRRVLLWVQTAMMILAAILAVLTITDVVQVWMILVLAFLLGIANAVDMPVRQAFSVELVGHDDVEPGGRAQLGHVQRRPGHRPGRLPAWPSPRSGSARRSSSTR